MRSGIFVIAKDPFDSNRFTKIHNALAIGVKCIYVPFLDWLMNAVKNEICLITSTYNLTESTNYGKLNIIISSNAK